MFQPIQIFQSSSFPKIPLHKSIFSPFIPFKTNANIKNQYDRLRQQYNFEKIETTLDRLGNCQYIYGYNSQFLDIISCPKNSRIRFILPLSSPKTSQKLNPHEKTGDALTIKIIRHILVIVFKEHVYIHDLIRHNNRLILQAFKFKQTHIRQIGVAEFKINQPFIYVVYALQAKCPTLSIQLYGINMSENFNVVGKMNRLLRVQNQHADIERLCGIDANNKLLIAVMAKNADDNQKILKIFCIQEAEEDQQTYNNPQNIKIKTANCSKCYYLYTFSVDPIFINDCAFFQSEELRYSSIRDSWASRYQSSQIQMRNQQYPNIYICQSQISYIIYEQDSTSFLVILKQKILRHDKYHETIMLTHNAKIKQILQCGTRTLILDQHFCIWSYDLTKHELIYLPEPELLINFTKYANKQFNGQIQSVLIFKSEVQNKFCACFNNTVLCFAYPHLIYQNIFSNIKQYPQIKQTYSNANQTPTFLSIQSQNYVDFSCVDQTQKKQTLKLIKSYISFCSTDQKLDVRRYLFLQFLPNIGKKLSVCASFTIRSQELWNMFLQIVNKLSVIKQYIQQTQYDSESNKFYWNLINILQFERCQKDIRYVIQEMTRQYMRQSKDVYVLKLILNEHNFRKYLLEKCKNTNYVMRCTNHFTKCILLQGCNCVYKRTLRYCLKQDHRITKLFKLNSPNLYQQLIRFYNIITILSSSGKTPAWQQQLYRRLNQQQLKIQQRLRQARTQQINKIDLEWDKQFGTEHTFKIMADQQFYRRGTVKKQIENYQISYNKSQQQQNGLFHNLPALFAQTLIKVDKHGETSCIRHGYERELAMRKYLQHIQNICDQYQLFYDTSDHSSSQKLTGKSDTLAMCILVALKLYQKYRKEISKQQQPNYLESVSAYSNKEASSLNLSYSSYSLDRQMRDCLSSYRRLWIIIIRVLCHAVRIKYGGSSSISYQTKEHLQNMLNLIASSIINPKYFPALVSQLMAQIESKTLLNEEFTCLIQSIILLQIYRFQISPPSKSLNQLKYFYHPQVWSKGILKVIQISQKIKELTHF